MQAPPKSNSPVVQWLLQGYLKEPEGPYEGGSGQQHQKSPWYKVMCLTGVDYFSTLGYQPGIAALAAGALSPIATLVLVLLTLFGALPIYRRVAMESPQGEGSISMLERLLPWWQGKLFVLALLGFVATDFVITITLSAADATVHLIENPFLEHHLDGQNVPVTLLFVALLGAVFLKGFGQVMGIAVVLVIAYLGLNCVVVAEGLRRIVADPSTIARWEDALAHSHGGNPLMLMAAVLFVFPRLALGLSGFETGVAVMPLVKGAKSDTNKNPAGRIKNTHRLLTSAALIMSVFLLTSSFVTTLLIPASEFLPATATSPAGEASGRALAYLAHEFYGDTFGTVYDVSTILILWFAGASAMAGLLNIVPRYLPRHGMAPEWTRAVRPLVLVFTGIAFLITIVFRADVNAQGAAYATGVLVLMTSSAVAVTISAQRRQARSSMWTFGLIAVVFAYTTILNIVERPDGIRIASLFIVTIVVISLVSRFWRTLELRVNRVDLDLAALHFVNDAVSRGNNRICLLPNRSDEGTNEAEYAQKEADARRDHLIGDEESVLFVEVTVSDASDFSGIVSAKGVRVGPHQVLRVSAVAVPNALAALAIRIQHLTNERPHIYFNWGERHPALYLVKYLFAGRGDIGPLTREILRRAVPDPDVRPIVHAA